MSEVCSGEQTFAQLRTGLRHLELWTGMQRRFTTNYVFADLWKSVIIYMNLMKEKKRKKKPSKILGPASASSSIGTSILELFTMIWVLTQGCIQYRQRKKSVLAKLWSQTELASPPSPREQTISLHQCSYVDSDVVRAFSSVGDISRWCPV